MKIDPDPGGIKRGAPDTATENSIAKRARPRTPTELVDAWMKSLQDAKVFLSADLAQDLSDIAHGTFNPRERLYDTLLFRRAYDVFVEVFATNVKNEQLDWECKHRFDILPPPFKSTFVLNVPLNDQPDYMGMADALQRIQPDAVHVIQDRPAGSRWSLEPFPMPEGVAHCVAALLKGGATELRIYGTLSAPEVIVDAFVGGRLESIVFEGSEDCDTDVNYYDVRLLSPTDLASYRVLASGLRDHTQLRHIKICNGQLLELDLHEALAGKPLASVHLTLKAAECCDDGDGIPQPLRSREEKLHLLVNWSGKCAEIVRVAGRSPTLSLFQTDVFINSTQALKNQFLAPLENHPSLTSLTIHSLEHFAVSKDNMQMFPSLIDFAATCPSLERLACTGLEREEDDNDDDAPLRRLQAFLARGGDIDLLEQSKGPSIEKVKSPTFRLEYLCVNGMTLARAWTGACMRALRGNSWLREVNLDQNLMNLPSVLELLYAVRDPSGSDGPPDTNLVLEKATVPPNFSNYWMAGSDGKIFGFLSGYSWWEQGEAMAFTPKFAVGMDDDARAKAVAPYQSLLAEGNGLWEQLQRQLKMNLRQARWQVAQPEMHQNLNHFLHAAARSDAKQNPSLFDKMAGIMAQYLYDERALTSVVRLPEVSRAADGRRRHMPDQRPFRPTPALLDLVVDDLYAARARRQALEEDAERSTGGGMNDGIGHAEDVDRNAPAEQGHTDNGNSSNSSRAAIPAQDVDGGNSTTTTTTTTTSTTATTTTTGTATAGTAPGSPLQPVQFPGAPKGFESEDDPENWF